MFLWVNELISLRSWRRIWKFAFTKSTIDPEPSFFPLFRFMTQSAGLSIQICSFRALEGAHKTGWFFDRCWGRMNDGASSHLGCLPCTWWDRGDRTEGLVAKAGRWCQWTRHWCPVRPCDSAGPNKKDIVFVGGVWMLKGSRAIFAAEASGKKELDAVCPCCNLSRVRVHLGRLRGSISASIVASIDVTRSLWSFWLEVTCESCLALKERKKESKE